MKYIVCHPVVNDDHSISLSYGKWRQAGPLTTLDYSRTLSVTNYSRPLHNGYYFQKVTLKWGARIAQSVVCWASCTAWCSAVDSIFLWASGRGDFSLGVNMGSDSISQNTLSDESINRDLVWAQMHSITWTQNILTFMSWMGECWRQKHIKHAPPTKTEYDYLNGWIKNGHIRKNLTQNGEA